MTLTKVIIESIPLSRATLCEDCRQITAATNGHCPICGGRALVNLENLLSRNETAPKPSSI
jgi:hypothetical protein